MKLFIMQFSPLNCNNYDIKIKIKICRSIITIAVIKTDYFFLILTFPTVPYSLILLSSALYSVSIDRVVK
jgi:hypothetical protein